MTLALKWGWSTDVGQVRQVNQDAAAATGDLFVVADGMGGHRGGEVAADIAAGHLQMQSAVGDVDQLAEEIIAANTMIRARASVDTELTGMGTTIVALALLASTDERISLAAANVGDSRMYVFYDDVFAQLTDDHSLVGELVRAGQITPEEAGRHPQRNVVTRALGVEDGIDVDTWEFPAMVGQRYLLCTDGLIDEISDGEIADVLRQVSNPKLAAMHLVDMANRAGGRDNITVLIVDVIDEPTCETQETEN